jgi:hypothetical protein
MPFHQNVLDQPNLEHFIKIIGIKYHFIIKFIFEKSKKIVRNFHDKIELATNGVFLLAMNRVRTP